MLTIIVFLLTIGLLAFVHELGHFLAAKIIGVEVKTFALGFPPKLWSKKVGETEYKINLLPIGGYVSLRGEGEGEEADEKEKNNPKSLVSRKPWELLFVFAAGVIMNLILAVLILWGLYIAGFQPIYPDMWNHKGVDNSLKAVVTEVEKGSPAEKDGILAGDVILEINGNRVYTYDQVVAEIRSKSTENGAKVDVKIDRKGEILNKNIETYKSKVAGKNNTEVEITRIGVLTETQGKIQGNIFSGFTAAVSEVFKIAKLTFLGIIDLFRLLITRLTISNNVLGPVGIVSATGYFIQLGAGLFLQFVVLISVSLAIFNILPIPALDGGHILFTLLETGSRRKFSAKTKNTIQLVGFGLLILLILFVTFKDIINLGLFTNIMKIFKR